jgi:hypothetical protein
VLLGLTRNAVGLSPQDDATFSSAPPPFSETPNDRILTLAGRSSLLWGGNLPLPCSTSLASVAYSAASSTRSLVSAAADSSSGRGGVDLTRGGWRNDMEQETATRSPAAGTALALVEAEPAPVRPTPPDPSVEGARLGGGSRALRPGDLCFCGGHRRAKNRDPSRAQGTGGALAGALDGGRGHGAARAEKPGRRSGSGGMPGGALSRPSLVPGPEWSRRICGVRTGLDRRLLPASGPAFEILADRQHLVLRPGLPDDLDSDGESFRRGAGANHGRRPAGGVVDSGVRASRA